MESHKIPWFQTTITSCHSLPRLTTRLLTFQKKILENPWVETTPANGQAAMCDDGLIKPGPWL
jgi:hypothetical protein